MAGETGSGSGMIPFEDVKKHFTAVCMIECKTSDGKPNGGTGFIGCISNNPPVLFTNNHVIPTVKCAEKAFFTFGFRDKDNKGTDVAGDELLDTKQWQTNQSFMEDLVGLDFTMIGVKEDKIKELKICPFDLTPNAVTENDQLVIPQHPLTKDYKERTPLSISLGPCKKILEFLMLYDCKTFHASSGSPVLKVVDGKLQVVAIHRGFLHGTYYNLSSRFSDVLNYISSTDNKVPELAKQRLRDFGGKVKWKPIKMIDLLTTLKPVAADWKQLAFILFIKKDKTTLIGMVKTIEKDCYHDTTSDNALSVVVQKWLVRTERKDRTWQTLLDVAEMLEEHEMLKYLEKNNISKDKEPEMHDVNKWCHVSTCRSDWYEFASALLPKEEARAIESNLRGDGSKECLRRVLRDWMSFTVDSNWGMVVDALQQLPEATVVVEKILDKFKL